jgi:hypothetical protein
MVEKGNNLNPDEIGKLGEEQRIYINPDEFIKRLEVRRGIKYQDGNPSKTYGNVSPDDESYEEIDKTSLIAAQRAQTWIRKYTEWYPDELCSVVNKLVKKGKEYESIKYVETRDRVEYGKQVEEWVDGAESSRMVKETIIGLGKGALEYLDENDEYSKDLAKKIRGDIRNQKIKEIFKNLLPRKK